MANWKKFKKFVKKVAKPVAAIAAIVYPPLIPLIGSSLGATGAAASIVGAAALSGGASALAGDKPKDILKNAVLAGGAAGIIQAVSPTAFDKGLLSGGGGAAATTAPATTAATTASTGTGLLSGSTGAGLTAGSTGTGLSVGGSGLGLSTGSAGLGLTAASPGAAAIGGSLGTTLAGISTGIGAAGALSGAGSAIGAMAPVDYGLTSGASSAASKVASDVASKGLVGDVLKKASEITGIGEDTLGKLGSAAVQTLISSVGASKIADQAKESAKIQSDATIEAARIAADAAKFRPVGVTTRFGASNFTTDAQGNVIGAGYTPSAEITGYQDRLRTLAGQGMTDIEGARAAYQPLTGAAQSLFGLGQGYLTSQQGQPLTDLSKGYLSSQAGQPLTSMGQRYMESDIGQPLYSLGQGYLARSPDQVAADYIKRQSALLAPQREQELAQLQNKLLAQGRSGLSVAQGGGLMATTPELAALYNARAQQELELAAQAELGGQQAARFGADLYSTGRDLTRQQQLSGADLYGRGRDLTRQEQLTGADLYGRGIELTQQGQTFGAGLFDTGANLQNRFYSGQTAAYAPFATAMDTSVGLENLAQQPLEMGINIGGRTTAGTAAGGRFLGEGIVNAAATMAPSNAFSGSGQALSTFGQSPEFRSALNNVFGVAPQGKTYTADEVLKLFGT